MIKIKTTKTITHELEMDEAQIIQAVRAYLTKEHGPEWAHADVRLFTVAHEHPVTGDEFAREVRLSARVTGSDS